MQYNYGKEREQGTDHTGMYRTEREWRSGDIPLHYHKEQKKHDSTSGAQEIQSLP